MKLSMAVCMKEGDGEVMDMMVARIIKATGMMALMLNEMEEV